MQLNTDYFFKIIMKLCNSVKYTGHKCEFFNYCYMCFLFELAYKLWMDIIVAIHVTKLLTKNFSLSAYGVRYFLGQYMRPFKLYQFFDEINQ